MNTRSKIMLLLVFIGALILGIGAVYLYAAGTQSPATKQPVEPAAQEEKEVSVHLPGADPVPAILSDYTNDDNLWVVVNKERPLNNLQYRPADLQLITAVKTRSDKSEEEHSLRQVAMQQAVKFLEAAAAAGHDLMVGSAFRSYELQNTYYTNYVRTSGQVEADTYSAKPGYSEHQTGLAFDLAYTNMHCYLETCFGQTEAGIWLAEHAEEYGFILRYPADKTDVTGYQYEPWHFRFVGAAFATALKQSGLTLDEAQPYLERARDELIAEKHITVQ